MRDWTDIGTDGRRLNRLIRRLEKKLNKTEDDDKINKYASTIGILTEKKLSLAKLYLGIEDALDKVDAR